MLNVTVQNLGNATVLHCKGRIVLGDACSTLPKAVISQAQSAVLVLDLAQVDRIDAGGLGTLLKLREWAEADSRSFKLMNVPKTVEQILELTNLRRVFEFCSVPDLLCLLHHAASIASWSARRSNPAHADDSGEQRSQPQEEVPAVGISGLMVNTRKRAGQEVARPQCEPTATTPIGSAPAIGAAVIAVSPAVSIPAFVA